MARRRQRWTREERDALLAACAASGLSAWAFAREAAVPYTTLLHWKALGAAYLSGRPHLAPPRWSLIIDSTTRRSCDATDAVDRA